MLFEIILAAHFMEITPLVDLGCKTVANMIKGKSAEEIRKVFNIQNDFTPEEEEQIRRENEWAEDVDYSYQLDNNASDAEESFSQESSNDPDDPDELLAANNLLILRHGTGLSIESTHKQRGLHTWRNRILRYTPWRMRSSGRGSEQP